MGDGLYPCSRDVLGTWKHYNLSAGTLAARNTRARSPLQSRELDRYFETRKRVNYNLSAGTWRSSGLPSLQLQESALLWRFRQLPVHEAKANRMERGEATLSNQKPILTSTSSSPPSSFHGGDDDVGFLKRTNDILKLLKL